MVIPSWYQRPGYVRAMADLIVAELTSGAFPQDQLDEVEIFFSAHGVPVSYIEEGEWQWGGDSGAGLGVGSAGKGAVYLLARSPDGLELGGTHLAALHSRPGYSCCTILQATRTRRRWRSACSW